MTHRLLQDPGLPVANPTASYWQTPPNEDVYDIQSPCLPETRDVVVLGSGITGLSVSWWLAQLSDEISISVLDARQICSGATGRNGGRINCTAVQDYDKYRKLFGHEKAVEIVRFELAHFDSIYEFAKQAGEDVLHCSEVRRVGAVSAVFSEEQLLEVSKMLDDFERAFPDLKGEWRIVGRTEAVDVYKIANAHGALIGKAGAAWPYRLVTSVFSQLQSKLANRFSLEANTPALALNRSTVGEYPYHVITPRGVIKAKHVVHCTEGHAAHLLPRLRGILVPRRGQITVQNPASGFPKRSNSSWSFLIGDILDYATQSPTSGHIIIGGGETSGKAEVLGIPSDAEEDVLALSHLGGILPAAFGVSQWGYEVESKKRIAASWTGILCNSLDKVPLVGMLTERLLDRSPGSLKSAEWISSGYGGYGMVNAFLCGKNLAYMIAGMDLNANETLPEVYHITPRRVEMLQQVLKQVLNSREDHARALL